MNSIFRKVFSEYLSDPAPQQIDVDDMDEEEDIVDGEKKKKKKSRHNSPEELEKYAKEKWENVLTYMVSTTTSEKMEFLDSIKKLLNWSQLVTLDEETSDTHITTEGFQFLLQETRSQVWKLLKQYLDSCESRKQVKIEALQFLFELSFLRIGEPKTVKGLTPTQTVMLLDLSELGIVCTRHPRFYPTSMVIGITQASSDGRVSMLDDKMGNSEDTTTGHIMIETNYRVYAYTKSNLQIALLSLFAQMDYRLPNMVVGLITRESVREAFKNGITADQILGYLYLHAHPQMRKKRPVIPETVADQIRLWEGERNRVAHHEGVLYDKFPNPEKFDLVVNYCKQLNMYLWSSDDKLILVGKREGHEMMKLFIKANV
jgi:transcription initiation factor TFIIH subunit 4